MVESRNAFWQAFVFTIFIFVIGIAIGFFVENSRNNDVELAVLNSEINLIDEQLRNEVFDNFDLDCEVAVNNLFNFADRIYEEAFKLERYDDSSTFTDSLEVLHKRYDLLRVLLWSESIKINKRCGDKINTLVYLYPYKSNDLDVRGKEIFYSRLVYDVKSNNPDKILLIPLASDLGLSSVEIILDSYNVSSLPAIIVNEKIVLVDVSSVEELENMVFDSNNK